MILTDYQEVRVRQMCQSFLVSPYLTEQHTCIRSGVVRPPATSYSCDFSLQNSHALRVNKVKVPE